MGREYQAALIALGLGLGILITASCEETKSPKPIKGPLTRTPVSTENALCAPPTYDIYRTGSENEQYTLAWQTREAYLARTPGLTTCPATITRAPTLTRPSTPTVLAIIPTTPPYDPTEAYLRRVAKYTDCLMKQNTELHCSIDSNLAP
jgi:hypothetical protein